MRKTALKQGHSPRKRRAAKVVGGEKDALQQELEHAREYAETIVQLVPDPLVVLDDSFRVISANPAFFRLFGSDTKNTKFFPFLLIRNSARLQNVLSKSMSVRNAVEDFHVEMDSPATGRGILVLNARPFLKSSRDKLLMLLTFKNVTKQKDAESERESLLLAVQNSYDKLEGHIRDRTAELQDANSRLKTMSARILEAHETERRKIARELHDEIGQALTCLQIVLFQQFSNVPPHLKAALTEARTLAMELLNSIRELSAALRPQLLDDLGLVAALQWHFKRFQNRTNILIEFEGTHFKEGLPDPFFNSVIYRVIQEGLTNVARHAATKRVQVRLETKDHHVQLQIRDGGKGFDQEAPMNKGCSGLNGMRERVFLAGGEINIRTAPNKGTSIEVRLPCTLSKPRSNTYVRPRIDKPAEFHNVKAAS